MKAKRSGLAGATAVIAILTAACGHTATAASHATCRQQFETWNHGPGLSAIRADRSAVSSAIHARNLPALKRAFEKLGAAAATVGPAPHCADPAGYYRQIEAKLAALGDQARSVSGPADLPQLALSFRVVGLIGQKLNAELIKTVGKNY